MSLNPQLGSAPITAGPLTAIDRANISLPYASGGGGGGSAVSTFNQLFTSSIGTSDPGNVDFAIIGSGSRLIIDTPTPGQLLDIQFQVSTVVANGGNAPAIACTDLGGQNYLMSIGAPGGVGMTTSISSLSVSSINGVAPGGSLFQSTFTAVPCPGNTSTILMEMPAGQYGFNGLIVGSGATSMLSGNVNVVIDQSGPDYWGQINQLVGSQPAGSFPAQMVINQGDSKLSTIKLIVAATTASSGAFTGVVSKLY